MRPPAPIPTTPNPALDTTPAAADPRAAHLATLLPHLGGAPAAPAPRRSPFEFRPLSSGYAQLASSLFWSVAGTEAFRNGGVPHGVHSGGAAAGAAAAVASALPASHGRLRVLEIGAGPGLFARLFCDRFVERNGDTALAYHVTDGSSACVEHWRAQGLFDQCPAEVHADVLDASDIGALARIGQHGPFDMVVFNYVLDSLPTDVYRLTGGAPERLETRPVPPAGAEAPPLAAVDAVRAWASGGPAPEYPLVRTLLDGADLETRWVATDAPDPFVRLLEGLVRPGVAASVHHGAYRLLDHVRALLQPHGVILISDYGPTTLQEMAQTAPQQSFSGSSAFPFAFPVLERYAADTGLACVSPPGDAERGLHVRLLGRSIPDAARGVFGETFGAIIEAATENAEASAMTHVAAGRADLALEVLRVALAAAPWDWLLLARAAEVQGSYLQRPAAALALAERAARLNPWQSSYVWITLGNARYINKDHRGAAEAFERALGVDPSDPQAWLSLAFARTEAGQPELTLEAVAGGLARDLYAQHRSALLAQQERALQMIAAREGEAEAARQRRQTALMRAIAPAKDRDA